jgi:hypothetical protein
MGCSTCKQNNSSQNAIANSLPNDITSNNIFFRFIAFFSVMIALPFVLLVLLGQIFIAFFFPKSYDSVSKRFSDAYRNIIEKNINKRREKEYLKRQEEFKEKGDYSEDSKLLDIEVYEENNEIKKEDG